MRERTLVRSVAIALLVTVVSQIFYIAVVSNAGDETILRPLTWLTELVAFTVVAVGGQALAARSPARAVIWSAIGFSGVLNVLQVAMGLSMFKPAIEAGAGQEQLFATVLAGAFFLYFLAKLIVGMVALAAGWPGLRHGSTLQRVLAGLAVLSGIAAVATNVLAMLDAPTWTFAAGATGTAATAIMSALLMSWPETERVR